MPHQSTIILSILLILGLSAQGISQQYDALVRELDAIDDIQSITGQIDELLEQYESYPDTVALLYNVKANILFKQTVSIEAAIEAIDLGLSNITYEDYPHVWLKLWYDKGFFYRKWDKYEEAKNALSEVLKNEKDNDYLWDATIQMGKTFKDRGEFGLALDYYRKAITLAADDKDQLASTYEVIAFVYLIMQTKEGAENALPWLEKLITLLNTMDNEEHFIANMTYNQGCAYMTLDNLKNARSSFEKSEQIMNSCCDNDDFKSLILESKAVLLKEEGEYDLAIDHFERSLTLYEHSFDLTRSDGLASTYSAMAETYQEMGHLDNALKYIDDALDYRLSGIDRDIESQIITQDLIIANGEKHYLIDELLIKGKILEQLAAKEQDEELRKKAIEAFLHADFVVDRMRFEHLEESTKQFWREKTTEVYQHLVSNYVNIKNTSQAFHYAEKSKYLLMGEHLLKNNSQELLSGLPPVLKSEYAQVQKDISIQLTHLKHSLLLNLDQAIDSIELILIDLRKKEDDILYVIKNEHVNFFNKNFVFQLASIKNIQENLLNQDQTLVEYFLADSSLFIFVINQQSQIIQEVDVKAGFEELIINLRNNITHQDRYESAYLKAYANDAAKLYDVLIRPVKDQLKENIVVVTDNIIALVPFSILLTDHPTESVLHSSLVDWPFVLYQYQVSFLHSASLELLNNKKKQDALYDSEILAFSPSFSNKNGRMALQRGDTVRGALLPLLGAEEEIDFARDLFRGQFFINTDATESNFKNALNSTYSIFHIASHAIIDDKFPDQSKLVLSPESNDDGMLYASEINNLKLKSDLVILSACNTGVGRVTNGEGLNSLARSFVHAGSQNILMSLWPVSDKSTTSLIQEYYQKLVNGDSKRKSLDDAKSTFLTNVPAAYHHPYFWGGFVYYGDDAPLRVSPKSQSNWNWIMAMIGFSILCFLYIWKARR